MPKRSARAEGLAGSRYRLLVDQLAGDVGKPQRGWQSEVARRLGVDRAYISKLLNPDVDLAVGVGVIDRACERLGLKREFFTKTKGYRRPAYTAFLRDDVPMMPLWREGPAPRFADLVGSAQTLEAKLDDGRAGVEDLHALALDVLAVPAVQTARRLAEMRPNRKANATRILVEGGKLIAALRAEGDHMPRAADGSTATSGYPSVTQAALFHEPESVYGAEHPRRKLLPQGGTESGKKPDGARPGRRP